MTDAELIADFIARNGVTVCPVGAMATRVDYRWREASDGRPAGLYADHDTSWRALKWGKGARASNKDVRDRRDKIAALYNSGARAREIANMLNMKINTVRKDIAALRDRGAV